MYCSFFNDTATTEIYTLSLHDALPICKEQKRLEAEKRQRLAPLRKKQQAAEKQMEKLQTQLDAIEETMADTSLYEASRKDELQTLLHNQAQLKSELENVEDRKSTRLNSSHV